MATKVELEKENSELRKQIEEMKRMFEEIKSANFSEKCEKSAESGYNNVDDPYVMVISLCNNELNLSTGGYGHGEVYTFSHFGEEQNIPVSDLKKIVKNNRSFITNGVCYIADKDFITSERLKKVYEKLIDSDKMIDTIMADKETFRNVFESIVDAQKETISDMLVQKIVDNEDVDMNIVKICGDIIGKDLYEIANSIKAVKNN